MTFEEIAKARKELYEQEIKDKVKAERIYLSEIREINRMSAILNKQLDDAAMLYLREGQKT